jgi:hypothetical protein
MKDGHSPTPFRNDRHIRNAKSRMYTVELRSSEGNRLQRYGCLPTMFCRHKIQALRGVSDGSIALHEILFLILLN